MKNLSVKTVSTTGIEPKYKENLKVVTTFLNHSEDRITVIKGNESINIEIYHNGEPLFLGDKHELFEILRNHNVQ